MKLATCSAAGSESRAGIVTHGCVIDIAKASREEMPVRLLDVMARESWKAELRRFGRQRGSMPSWTLARL